MGEESLCACLLILFSHEASFLMLSSKRGFYILKWESDPHKMSPTLILLKIQFLDIAGKMAYKQGLLIPFLTSTLEM